jgi:hypothetical protein
MVAVLLALVLSLNILAVAVAGSTLDYGQLPGTPSLVNYVAWMGNAGTPPSQVLTEDGYNSQTGVNQGYQSGYWLLNASNFNNPAAADGNSLNFIFGGLGSNTGTIWIYSATYDINAPLTNHGTVGSQESGTCPGMTQGSWDGSQKVINWSGPAGKYLIFRSTEASGAGNGASNGRYNYVATVTTTGPAGTYTDNVSVPSWHIVVPADPDTNAIIGCHSEESNPTAISLISFKAASTAGANWLYLVILGILVISLVGVGYYRFFSRKI